MHLSSTIVLTVALVSAFGNSGHANIVKSKIGINNIIVDDYFYYEDTSTTLRTRDAAARWCQSQGAELAKVRSAKIYNVLRMSLRVLGNYWIDGVDKNDISRFVLDTTNCSSEGDMNMVGIPAAFPTKSCLAFAKGSNATMTRIISQDCVTLSRVLCGYPIANDGCTPAPTSSTTTIVP